MAAIFSVAPVCGLRPVRAERSVTEKVPKPVSVTASPFDNDLETAPVKLLTELSAWDLVSHVSPAMWLIRSALFMINLYFCNNSLKVIKATEY